MGRHRVWLQLTRYENFGQNAPEKVTGLAAFAAA
jgi:hypothetical protein